MTDTPSGEATHVACSDEHLHLGDDLIVQTRPSIPPAQRTAPHHWITDEVAAEARRLWQSNPNASQIECALIAASRAIVPLCEEAAELRQQVGRLNTGETPAS